MKKALIPTLVFKSLTLILIPLALPPFAHSKELVTPSLSQPPSKAIVIPLGEESKAIEAEAPQLALPTVPIPLTNVTNYIMDGIATEIFPNQQRVHNMRIKSDQTSLADYLRIKYNFRKSDQKFVPIEIVKYGGVGIYNYPYFVKNVPANITMTYGSQTMSMGQTYSLTSTASSVYTMNLKAGHVISFTISNQTDDYRLKIINPYGEIIAQVVLAHHSGVIAGEYPILASGLHRIKFEPLHASSFSFTLRFLNANRQSLVTLTDGDPISVSFYYNLRDHAKYAIDLVKGQQLTVTKPSNPDMNLSLLNRRNAIVAQVLGLPMLYEVPASGRYYLFIDNSKGWGGSYSGSVHIE